MCAVQATSEDWRRFRELYLRRFRFDEDTTQVALMAAFQSMQRKPDKGLGVHFNNGAQEAGYWYGRQRRASKVLVDGQLMPKERFMREVFAEDGTLELEEFPNRPVEIERDWDLEIGHLIRWKVKSCPTRQAAVFFQHFAGAGYGTIAAREKLNKGTIYTMIQRSKKAFWKWYLKDMKEAVK